MRPIPTVLWAIIDTDETVGVEPVLLTTRTRTEARYECKRFNSIMGYEPTCRVVQYVRASVPTKGKADHG